MRDHCEGHRAGGNVEDARPAVLFVDDSPVLAEIGVAMIDKLGYCPHYSADGYQAVIAFQEYDFVAIFMDIHMPKVDGIMASQFIKEQAESIGRQLPPIIALTATIEDGLEERCRHVGIVEMMTKPFTLPSLRGALEKVLD